MSIWLGDKKLAGTSVKLSHNIGDIFTTSRTDTVLAGAVECNGATYQTTSYTGEGSIGELLESGKLDYISLTAYATAIAQTGWCDKIGWDGAGNTQFRVPTINPRHYIIKTQKPTAENNYTWYKLYADGWVEQGGKTSTSTVFFPIIMADTNYTFVRTNGAGRAGTTANELYTSTTNRTTNSIGLSLESAITPVSWEISGMSSITPRTNTRVMIQLFNGVTDEALATCENVENDVQSLKTSLNNKITNCITNIPQDIKLELNNGTLTLKAGSKIYVPNGPGVFDVKNTTTDIMTTISNNSTYLVCVQAESDAFDYVELVKTYSGASNPGQTYSFWYDTTSNLVKLFIDDTSTPARTESLPIAIVTITNGAISSIDQVFNGFGYIGSTVFVLPGVKGLIPDGRNADGSLKNIPVTLNNVSINAMSGLSNANVEMLLRLTDGVLELKSTMSDTIYYNANDNHVVRNGVTTTEIMCGNVLFGSNAKITNSTLKTTFHALDYNDTEYIAHNAMPSDRYVDLTLGASDTYYTAPADGYFLVSKIGNSGQFLNGYITPASSTGRLLGTSRLSSTNGIALTFFLPVRKGQRLYMIYTASGATTYFRFIYAEGAQ